MRYKQAYYESLHIQTILIAKITVFTSAASVTAVKSVKRLEHPCASATSLATELIMAFVILIMKPYSSFIYNCMKPDKSMG